MGRKPDEDFKDLWRAYFLQDREQRDHLLHSLLRHVCHRLCWNILGMCIHGSASGEDMAQQLQW